MTHLKTIQNMLILLCQCIICYNIVAIIPVISRSLLNSHRDEENDNANENDAANNKINTKKK